MTSKIFSVFIILLTIVTIESCKKEYATPTLSTTVVNEITLVSAKSGGEITDNGGDPVTVRGICWSNSQNPDITGSHTTDGSGSGIFTSNISGIVPGTTYYVRAYASNSAGTGYGNQVTFTTLQIALPTLTTTAISGITLETAISGGNITADGGSPVTARGICWSTTENPTVTNSKTTDGTGTGIFESNITGLTGGTTYYVRAYATNSAGTVYGNQLSFSSSPVTPPVLTTSIISAITTESAVSGGDITADGGSAVTARGICWSTSENPTVTDSKTTDGTGTGVFVSNITGLTGSTVYYVRAYATNSAGTAYGNQLSFPSADVVPASLTTTQVSDLTSTTGVSGGTISSAGGGTITAKGICWGTSLNPTIADSFTNDGTGMDTFTSSVTGLTNGTVYHVRAYATNNAGTAYGNDITFITPVTDIEGNIYKTVVIGNQIWMAENLKVERLNDNTSIPNVTDNAAWISQTNPALCWLSNHSSNKNTFGAIYNWFTVNTGNLCPTGWHVPTDAEYNTMEQSIGIPASELDSWGFRGTNQGTSLKSTTTWNGSGNGSNSSGFNALPGGYRQWITASFPIIGEVAYFWSASDDAINGHPSVAWYRRLDAADPRVYKGTTEKTAGKYVRCVKNP